MAGASLKRLLLPLAAAVVGVALLGAHAKRSRESAAAPVAVVDSAPISAAVFEARLDAEPGLREDLAGVNGQFAYAAKRTVLDQLIDEHLLERDARQRGATLAEVRQAVAETVGVSSGDIDVSYQLAQQYRGDNPLVAHRCRRLLAGDEAAARQRIAAFVRAERIRIGLLERARPLRASASIALLLPTPAATTAARAD